MSTCTLSGVTSEPVAAAVAAADATNEKRLLSRMVTVKVPFIASAARPPIGTETPEILTLSPALSPWLTIVTVTTLLPGAVEKFDVSVYCRMPIASGIIEWPSR